MNSMETAPKDGTWVLLSGGYWKDDAGRYEGTMAARWYSYATESFWAVSVNYLGYDTRYENPTGWMPMP